MTKSIFVAHFPLKLTQHKAHAHIIDVTAVLSNFLKKFLFSNVSDWEITSFTSIKVFLLSIVLSN